VVHDHDEHVVLRAQGDERGRQQRAALEVEGALGLVGDDAGRVRVALFRVEVADLFDLQGYPLGRVDHLHRTAVDGVEGGAQALVAGHDLAQRSLQSVAVERAAEAQGLGDVVLGTAGLELVQEPQALLRKRQLQLAVAVDRLERRPL
jgi:hypothetical protein